MRMNIQIFQIFNTLFNAGRSVYKHTKNKKVELFNFFIEPAFKDIEMVHNNYLECFSEYLDFFKTNDFPFDMNHTIIKKIAVDSIFTENLRQKVWSFYNNYREIYFCDFVILLNDYFKEDNYFYPKLDFYITSILPDELLKMRVTNSSRFSIIHNLTLASISSSKKNQKNEMIEMIVNKVKTHQNRFKLILECYNQIKVECFH